MNRRLGYIAILMLATIGCAQVQQQAPAPELQEQQAEPVKPAGPSLGQLKAQIEGFLKGMKSKDYDEREDATGKLRSLIAGSTDKQWNLIAYLQEQRAETKDPEVNSRLKGIIEEWPWKHFKKLFSFRTLRVEFNSIAFSPDGSTLAAACNDGAVRMWSLDTVELKFALKGHADEVNQVVFSPDGKLLVSVQDDETVRIWHAPTGKFLARLRKQSGEPGTIAFKPDGSMLAAVDDEGKVRFWDTHTWRCAGELKEQPFKAKELRFSANGRLLAFTGSEYDDDVDNADEKICIWDVSARKCTHILEADDDIFEVSFSRDSGRLASSDKHAVTIWDVSTGEKLLKVKDSSYAESLVFAPYDSALVTDNGEIYNPRTGELLCKHSRFSTKLVVLSPTGRILAHVGDRDVEIEIWGIPSPEAEEKAELENLLEQVASNACEDIEKAAKKLQLLIRRSGVRREQVLKILRERFKETKDLEAKQRLRSFLDPYVKPWAFFEKKFELKGHREVFISAAFSPDGKLLATAHRKTVYIWDVQAGKCLHQFTPVNSCLSYVVFSPDGKFLVSGGVDYFWDAKNRKSHREARITAWDVKTWQCVRKFGEDLQSAGRLAFSPDGKLLASGSHPKIITIWDFETGKHVRMIKEQKDISSIAFSTDGTMLASTDNYGNIRIWDPHTGKRLRRFKDPLGDSACIAFTANGKWLASGGRTIRFWEPKTGRLVWTLASHEAGEIYSFAVSPDIKCVAAQGHDNTLRIWDVESSECIRALERHKVSIRTFACSRDGKMLATGFNRRTIVIWTIPDE